MITPPGNSICTPRGPRVHGNVMPGGAQLLGELANALGEALGVAPATLVEGPAPARYGSSYESSRGILPHEIGRGER